MPKAPAEPTNIVLEQLRLMREDHATFAARVMEEFKLVRSEISILRRQTIGEVYKANKTFASFSDLEERVEPLERRAR